MVFYKYMVLITSNNKMSWIEILEAIDREYPGQATVADGLIEDKPDKAAVNMSQSNEQNRSGLQHRGGANSGRSNGGLFQGILNPGEEL
jgi:hypothetical protein